MDVRRRYPGDQMWAALWQVVPDRLQVDSPAQAPEYDGCWLAS